MALFPLSFALSQYVFEVSWNIRVIIVPEEGLVGIY
jgi:hypothetical protein